MSTPLKWNAPGLRWNAGLKWNGTQTTTRTMYTKAIVDFSGFTAPELAPVAQTIHDQMTANAATFPSPPTSMPTLATLISTYNTKLAARASRASADVLAFNVARHDLEVALHDLGVYVNLAAKGDPTILVKSGFETYTTGGGGGGGTPGPAPIPAGPQNLRLVQGDLSGSVRGRCKPDRTNSYNIAQINLGDPNNAAGWVNAIFFTGGKFTLTNLAVATTVWIRVATIGTGGQVGPWSDPAKIVVT